MEESTPELAATRYRRVIEGYKSRLRTNPDLKLSEYCKESHTNYRGVIDWTKRLERGFFEMPRKNADTGYYELSWETFIFIMSGISLESVCFRKRYRTRFMGIQSFDYQ